MCAEAEGGWRTAGEYGLPRPPTPELAVDAGVMTAGEPPRCDPESRALGVPGGRGPVRVRVTHTHMQFTQKRAHARTHALFSIGIAKLDCDIIATPKCSHQSERW